MPNTQLNYYVQFNDGTSQYVEGATHQLSELATKIICGNVTHMLFNRHIKQIKITKAEIK